MNRDSSRRAFLLGGGAWAAAAAGGTLLGIAVPGADAPDPRRPFRAPDASTLDLASHVLNRCSFGARPGDHAALCARGRTPELAVDAWIEEQLHPERLDDEAAARRVRRIDAPLNDPAGELYDYRPEDLARDLTRATLVRAVYSRRRLYEVMVHFWSDYFNIDMSKAECAWLKVADDREVIRRHALGRFGDLLRASALSPAMLWYLDGRANRRASPAERPNENYARELLELHTLGVHGGYAQRDVMEAARCLTGWTVRPRGRFGAGRVEFVPALHDGGAKTVLGHAIAAGGGPRDTDQLLAIVASHPSTGRHVATRLCRRFIADDPPESAIESVSRAFTASGGEVRAALRALLGGPEFRADPRVRGALLKRPFALVVSALRATDAETDGGAALHAALATMGQSLFEFPTPDGYPDPAAAWTGTLLARWRFAADLAADRLAGTRVDAAELVRRAGGRDALAAHLFGRRARAHDGGDARRLLAVLLAAPAFQRC